MPASSTAGGESWERAYAVDGSAVNHEAHGLRGRLAARAHVELSQVAATW
jgi:hypothetical protein